MRPDDANEPDEQVVQKYSPFLRVTWAFTPAAEWLAHRFLSSGLSPATSSA
ncbi:hypothetical protein HSB1_20900 [Halogranum salarium B-1]|uniref:Uncharacterized protein n=1 Tax=Halogranum salarium B-1 TaxID=1210908 RepID=J3EXP4_9EURY|nr:hypothetical protein HSB1_20900 [Halogranum salarium B-1]